MKPLLYTAVTLSLVWVTCGAPQPLFNTTTPGISNLTAVPVSESDDQKSTTPAREDLESSTVTGKTASDFESSSAPAKFREENDKEVSISESVIKETFPTEASTVVFTDAKSIAEETTEVKDSISTEPTYVKITENEQEISKSGIQISRYVPPLDPMKHMLMMADIKNILRVPSHSEKINYAPVTTTDSAISVDASSEPESVSSKATHIIEKVVAESSEIEEKHEPMAVETTPSGIHSTAVTRNSDELSTEKNKEVETSSIPSTINSLPITVSIALDTTIGSTERPEDVEETLTILKNSDEALKTETIKEKDFESNSERETFTTDFSSTEESIKVSEYTVSTENTTNNIFIRTTSPSNLFETFQDLTTEKTSVESEIATHKSISTTSNDGDMNNNGDVSTKIVIKDEISTESTIIVPETTFESLLIAAVEDGKKNISIEGELEFKAVKIPFNESKVSYVQYKSTTTRGPEIPEITSSTTQYETDSITSNIFTTIAEILFSPSSTTPPPEDTLTNTDVALTTTEESVNTSILPLLVDKEEILDDADSSAILSDGPADMLKVQLLKSELDSIPANETITYVRSTETTVTEDEALAHDSLLGVTESKLQDTTAETTSSSSEAATESTTTGDVITRVDTTTAVPTTPLESTPEEVTEENVQNFSNEPEVHDDPSAVEKPSENSHKLEDRYVSGTNKNMVSAVQFLHYHDKSSSEQCFKLVDAHWNYATNLTEENKKKQLEQTLAYSLFHKEAWKNATSFAWKAFNDTLLRRWFKSLSVLGTAALPEEKLNEFNKIKAEMKNTYSTAKVCLYVPPEAAKKGKIITEKDCNLTLEPDLQRILTKSRDYDELVHVWKSWRDAAGKPIREKYLRFVNLSNEAARMNGFLDTGDLWREAYESNTFEADLENLWEQLKPLYQHLHAYVRRRLIQQYGSDRIKEDGPIPAHLFGNMWAQSWVSLLDITQPFAGKPSVDVTPIMEAKNMTAYEMFKISEEFFTSLGLKPMPEAFWKHSLIEKPKDREIICHASAWDFCNGRDYRIKQCTDITMEDLITVHHEMGHIQYFLQYARQPNVFREGANPGFHEAIGDVLALSVSTPKHLKSIGLLDKVADDPEGDLNFLLYTALDKVSFLPSGYLIDLWRWGLFSGDIKPEEMNSRWWELRLRYQGICPPVKRTDTDFDPGAKFHVPGNVPYIRYFVSFVIQFQFHKVLCDAAGHTGPLYKCDIYRSKEAGQILSQVMELGSSEHWSEAMKIMTGGTTNKMDVGPILEYFEPLLEFLKEQNKNETLGWQSDDATNCP